MKKAISLFVITCVAALVSYRDIRAVPNPQDLRNGWYPNMPAVSETEVNKAIACLVENGAPANPSLETLALPQIAGRFGQFVAPDPDDPKFSPTDIVWKDGNGRIEKTNAMLTYLSPAVAYVDLAHVFDVPLSNLPKVRECAKNINPPQLVAMPSPIGPPLPSKCQNCFSSAGGDIDRFKGGAVYTDASGTYVKQENMFAFIRGSHWEKQ